MTIFFRKSQQFAIKSFIDSTDKLLKIFGPPGTGKTFITKALLKNESHTYYNCLESKKIPKVKGILIIDEFDHLPLKNYYLLENKTITIQNKQNGEGIFFNKYCWEEIFGILMYRFVYSECDDCNYKFCSKFECESDKTSNKENCNSNKKNKNATGSYLKNKIHGEKGNILKNENVAFNFNQLHEKEDLSGNEKVVFSLNQMDQDCSCARHKDIQKIEKIAKMANGDLRKAIDLFYCDFENPTFADNLHHRIIKKLEGNKMKAFEIYLEECKKIGIPGLGRADFMVIYDMYK